MIKVEIYLTVKLTKKAPTRQKMGQTTYKVIHTSSISEREKNNTSLVVIDIHCDYQNQKSTPGKLYML